MSNHTKSFISMKAYTNPEVFDCTLVKKESHHQRNRHRFSPCVLLLWQHQERNKTAQRMKALSHICWLAVEPIAHFPDYSGINVPLVAVCNVPPVAQCNVPLQKWLQ